MCIYRLESLVPSVPKPKKVKRETPNRLKRPSAAYSKFIRTVFERDGWRCRVPWCGRGGEMQCHHIRSRSLGGLDTLENALSLDPQCHRLVEEGFLSVTLVEGRVEFLRKRCEFA